MKTNSIGRFEGRLFVEAGRLCMVVEADEAAGIGRVSYRTGGRQQLVELPLREIGRRISSSANLALDKLSSPAMSTRIVRNDDGWFFPAREGLKGPYTSSQEAERALSQYVLSTQSS